MSAHTLHLPFKQQDCQHTAVSCALYICSYMNVKTLDYTKLLLGLEIVLVCMTLK